MSTILLVIIILLIIVAFDDPLEIVVIGFVCFALWDIYNKDSSQEKIQIIYVNKDSDSISEKEYWIEKLKEADNPDSILFYKQKILLEEFNSEQ